MIDKFIKEGEEKGFLISESTRNTYKTSLKMVEKFLNNQNSKIENITKNDIQKYAEEKINEGKSIKTIRTQLSAIKSFLLWLEKEEVLNEIYEVEKFLNGFIKQKKKIDKFSKREKNEPKPRGMVTEELIESAKEQFKKETPRNKALFALMLDSGCRISEVTDLKRSDFIELEDGTSEITIEEKRGRKRIIKFNKSTTETIKNYLKSRIDQEPYLFISNEVNKMSRGTVHHMLRKHDTNGNFIKAFRKVREGFTMEDLKEKRNEKSIFSLIRKLQEEVVHLKKENADLKSKLDSLDRE